MSEPIDALLVDLLEFIAKKERTYSEVISAWRTSCPRLPVWEEANNRGLVERRKNNVGGAIVTLTPAGREFIGHRQ
jgi:hypothetical protein